MLGFIFQVLISKIFVLFACYLSLRVLSEYIALLLSRLPLNVQNYMSALRF